MAYFWQTSHTVYWTSGSVVDSVELWKVALNLGISVITCRVTSLTIHDDDLPWDLTWNGGTSNRSLEKTTMHRWYGTGITELQSRIYIKTRWCKIAIATKWYQFHTTDKYGFLFMPWITDQYTFVRCTKLVSKIGTAVTKFITFSIMTT